MAAGFHRSISFPGSPRLLKARPASHIRSISLPCRSHPLISQLQEELRSVTNWISSSKPESSASICDGLARLQLLYTSLHDLLRLPQSQDALRHGSELTGRILDDFLRLADAHDTFRSEMVALNDQLSDAQVALRMKDNTKLASTTKNMKKTEKNITKIASSLRNFSKSPATRFSARVEEIEMLGVIREVINATVSTSVAVFMATASIFSATMKKRSVEGRSIEELQGFEENIGAVERRSERVLRCLINTRVTLLSLVNLLCKKIKGRKL